MIRTKIIATMGPAVASVPTLLKLFQAGCDICRLNFSHGSFEGHLAMLRNIREAAAQHTQPIAILGDLCGPKIRLGKVADSDGSGGMTIAPGDELTIQREEIVGGIVTTGDNVGRRVSINYDKFNDDVQVGAKVLVEDGLLRFVVTAKNADEVKVVCEVGGILKSNKGVNMPNTRISIPSITDRDWECVAWAIEHELDFLALSFVRSADDLQILREHLKKHGSHTHLIAKIEMAEAVDAIIPILENCDGIMVARGDLGVEMDLAEVPLHQKDLVRRARQHYKPVIVATQMLQSMVESASPTRAEVSDVANAILDGTDAVMLSGETSVGRYPIEAVGIMNHTASVTEKYQGDDPEKIDSEKPIDEALHSRFAIASAVGQYVKHLNVTAVVVFSQNGEIARVFSKLRLPKPIVALSSNPGTLRRMTLLFGIEPVEMEQPRDMTEFIANVDRLVVAKGLAKPGDVIVVVAGGSLETQVVRNAIVLHTVASNQDVVANERSE